MYQQIYPRKLKQKIIKAIFHPESVLEQLLEQLPIGISEGNFEERQQLWPLEPKA